MSSMLTYVSVMQRSPVFAAVNRLIAEASAARMTAVTTALEEAPPIYDFVRTTPMLSESIATVMVQGELWTIGLDSFNVLDWIESKP